MSFYTLGFNRIPYSYYAPKSYLETNVIGTYNVLNAAKINNISKTVVTSTKYIGTAKSIPITEDHPLNAQSPYAASKIGADQLALSFYRSFKLPVTIIRPFNSGSRQSTRAIIPTIITQILSNKKYKIRNLSPTRDFTFVEDTTESFIKAFKSKKTDGETINIGNNFEISIKQIIKILQKDFDIILMIQDKKRIREKKEV